MGWSMWKSEVEGLANSGAARGDVGLMYHNDVYLALLIEHGKADLYTMSSPPSIE